MLWNTDSGGGGGGGISDSGISQEEDGDLSEYVGDTSLFSTVTSPTISGSDYAINLGTDGTPSYIESSYTEGEYGTLSMYVYPEDQNNELLFVDADNGHVVFGVFFRANGANTNGVYYSGSNETRGSVTDSGATARDGGTELVSASNVSSQFYHIEFLNIDYSAETLDIAVDGTTVVSGEPFILSGVPETLQLNGNFGSSQSLGFVDKVDTGA